MSGQKSLNPWDYKPWWCQPWSILLTGTILISGSWFIWQIIWLTLVISVPVLTWMGFFLLIWPSLVRQSGILEKYFVTESEQDES
ncbi:hypothetical protein NIES2119_17085 [[Phormidium ambiguum] IAM M-71]|uniref:DUF6737 domain-containing protein n=1 Tax=[Phormidium ambiguum] IAM M-71 TaxID=454136 RepID=A0A1U7IGY0_9CYAN|nr:DUF6737 family protein [Phormidium ambiguum]OKH36362.1 hypothetical protein NIES2119_17085 [Phormidium ambiguum IAM M-71]